MKHKVIIAMSLVAARVMTYLMFSGRGFYHFLGVICRIWYDVLVDPGRFESGLRCEKGV